MRTIAAALFLVLSMSLAAAASSAPDGLRVMASPHDFATLVARLDKAVEKAGLFVVTRASASAGAAGRGIAIPGDMIVGVYRNDFAVRMLAASVEAGIEAPIRFHVVEGSDGKASLSYRTPSAVFAPYGGGEALARLARELDALFAQIAAEAVAP